MKRLFTLGLVVVLSLPLSSCKDFGLFGTSGISGKEAKQQIMDAAILVDILWAQAYAREVNNPPSFGLAVTLAIIVDDVVVPGIAGIDESKHYSVDSVNECVSKINSIGLLFGTWTGAATCNLETSPALKAGPIEL